MPGTYSNNETFTNNSSHWKLYYISGNGKNGKKLLAESHTGFKYYGDLSQSLSPALGMVPLNINFSPNAVLYNWHSKIVLVNKVAAESGLFY